MWIQTSSPFCDVSGQRFYEKDVGNYDPNLGQGIIYGLSFSTLLPFPHGGNIESGLHLSTL